MAEWETAASNDGWETAGWETPSSKDVNSSRVDQIPGVLPLPVHPHEPEPSLLDKVHAGVEAGFNTVSNLVWSAGAMPYGIAEAAIKGKDVQDTIIEDIQANPLQSKGELTQEYTQKVGDFLSRNIAPVMPEVGLIGKVPVGKIAKAEKAVKAGVAKEAAVEAVKPTEKHEFTSPSTSAQSLADKLHALAGERTVDTINAGKALEAIPAEARSEQVYHAMPTEEGRNLSEVEKDMVKTYIEPIQKENEALYKQAYEELEGHAPPEELNPHNVRSVEKSLGDKFSSFASGVMGGGSFSRRPGTTRARTMLAIESPNGTRRVIHQDGPRLIGYDENKKPIKTPIYIGKNSKEVSIGATLKDGSKVVEATTAEIEGQTGVKYIKDAPYNLIGANKELKSFIRETRFLKEVLPELVNSGFAFAKDTTSTPPKMFKGIEGHPILEKYWFDHRFAAVFEDSILHGGPEGGITKALEKANSAAIGTMFWNPQPHLFNAMDHLINTLGFDLLMPTRYPSIAKSAYKAYKDVSTVSNDYKDYIKEGWGLQYGNTVARDAMEKTLQRISPEEMDNIAKSFGMKGAELTKALYDKSRKLLWGGSDVMMLTARNHLASKRGVDVFNKALHNYVEAHNPNYRIPAQIGFDSLMKIPGMQEAIASNLSRLFSKTMQSRAFNTFGRYHYGQIRSLGTNLHDTIIQNEKSVQGRKDALKNLAFIGFNVGVIYPYLWDTIAKEATQNPNAEQRRSGASTIPYVLWNSILGDEEVTKLIAEAYNLPPITKALIELPENRSMFTGQHIWEPEDTTTGKAADITKYALGSTIAPVKSVQNIMEGKVEKELASQIGIKSPTDKDIETKAKIKKRNERAAERRAKKREED